MLYLRDRARQGGLMKDGFPKPQNEIAIIGKFSLRILLFNLFMIIYLLCTEKNKKIKINFLQGVFSKVFYSHIIILFTYCSQKHGQVKLKKYKLQTNLTHNNIIVGHKIS
jgi:hypothetical protein